MNCVNWSDCMSPELGIAIGTLLLATVGMITAIVIWLPKYVTRLAEQKLREKEQDLANEQRLNETEVAAKNVEMEIKRRQELALAETLERVLILFNQSQDRHAKTDERNADTQERSIEVQTRLITAIDAQTRAVTVSQSWQEERTNDFLDTANAINERVSGTERTSIEINSKADTLVTALTQGLEQIKIRLDNILIEAQKNPNKDALERIEKEIANLIILAKPISESAQALPELTDTTPLSEAVLPTPETIEEKKDQAA